MPNTNVAHSLDSKIRTKDVILDENVLFDSLLLSEKVFSGLTSNGFKKPSPIQLKSIPLGRCGFDMVVKSKSGTGKTLVFSVVALEMINVSLTNTQVLILAPTREIAVQIQDVIKNIGKFIEGLKVQSFIGGLSIDADKEKCKLCHICVGTPGRVKHLITQGVLNTNAVRLFVLDEADKLMESSFQNDINEIYNNLPERKQMLTTSATYPNDLSLFLSNYMLSPTHITAEVDTPMLLGLKQFVCTLKSHANVVQQMKVKNEQLVKFLSNTSFTQCLIFSNYQTRAESISNILNQKGWTSSYISAAQTQTQRLEVMNNLKQFKCRILLSTDLTSRGIDAANVDVVINYDIPNDAMTYLHRMGRAGRYGTSGVCINLAFEGKELLLLQHILGTIAGTNFTISKLPEVDGSCKDLGAIDTSTLEYINGVIPQENVQISKVKSEVLELKSKKFKKNTGTRTLVTNSTNDNMLNSSKTEVKTFSEKFDFVNTTSLLESMISGDILLDSCSDFINTEAQNMNLQQLSLADDYKKRKRSENELCRSLSANSYGQNREKMKREPDRNNTFYKNRALLSVSKILYQKSSPEKDDVDSIEHYLQVLKEEDQLDIVGMLNENHLETQNILQNIDEYFEPTQNKSDTLITSSDSIENIFKIVYNHTTKSNTEHWMDFLSATEVEKFKKFCLNSQNSNDNDVEYNGINYESPYDFEMEQQEKATDESVEVAAGSSSYQTVDDENYDFMKWVPVELEKEKPGDTKKVVQQTYFINHDVSEDSSSMEHFNSYYNQCSENLWQLGLSFDNVETFDDWFYYEWQLQVHSVRNYIQQNIYVEEMSKNQQFNRNK